MKDRKRAVSYLRLSSSANIGSDSFDRQRAAVAGYAKRAGVEIVAEFVDEAVSGVDAIEDRPGFREMILSMRQNGARMIVVETASRLARDLMIQEDAWKYLKSIAVKLVAVDSPDAFFRPNAHG